MTGTATLGGTLVALPEPGVYYLGEQFNFLRADGGVNGQFAKTDFSAFSRSCSSAWPTVPTARASTSPVALH